MILGLLKDFDPETRVALLPEMVNQLTKSKVEVFTETSAGARAYTTDQEYEAAGATILTRKEILQKAEVLLQIDSPDSEDLSLLKPDQIWISLFTPLSNLSLVTTFIEKKVTTFSLDTIPRITRAQTMDILSSMATVAGYKAVLEAAYRLPTFFPMFMTAAGTIRPANVLILGAGVAGLQAIATSRRLGAQVQVFDVRSAVREEVMSLGARFIEVEGASEDQDAGGYAIEQTQSFKQRQQKAINEHLAVANVVICTAQIPGKKAPLLITTSAVETMKPGSLIIDLAAATGGNCALTQNNRTIIHQGVTIIGQSNYPSLMPVDASRMFGKNALNFLKLIISKEGDLHLDFEDDIVKGTCITHKGAVFNQRVKQAVDNR